MGGEGMFASFFFSFFLLKVRRWWLLLFFLFGGIIVIADRPTGVTFGVKLLCIRVHINITTKWES